MSESYYSLITLALYRIGSGGPYSNQMFRNVQYTEKGLRAPVTVREALRSRQKARGICLSKHKKFWEL